MSPDKTEELFNKYPMLYRGKDKGPMKNLMCFGFECEDGWFDLVDELSRQICELSPMTEAFQIKEKYGTLCFYVGGAESVVFDIIEEFEDCSSKICEVCSAPGKIRGDASIGHWIKTLCDGCAERKGYQV